MFLTAITSGGNGSKSGNPIFTQRDRRLNCAKERSTNAIPRHDYLASSTAMPFANIQNMNLKQIASEIVAKHFQIAGKHLGQIGPVFIGVECPVVIA